MKKILISICMLFAMASNISADDSFSVENVTLPVNGEADVVVNYHLETGSTCSGYTFWLQLPEGLEFVTYVKNEKTYVTYTAGDCYDDPPTITPNIDGGYLKVGCLTANSDPLNKQEGTLVTFKVKVSAGATLSVGDVLTANLVQGTISAESGAVHDVADASFSITIAAAADLRTVLDETSTSVPAAATGVDVRVKRTINANEWSTICLPFAMTWAQVESAFGEDVQLADFVNYDITEEGDDITGITINFTDAFGIEANHPYIIKVSSAITEFTADGVDIDPDEENAYVEYNNGLSGKKKVIFGTFEGTLHAGKTLAENTLFLAENKFWYSAGSTVIKGFRAYFDLTDVLSEVEGSGARIMMDINGEETALSEELRVKSEESSAWYTLNGLCLDKKPTTRGIYIHNGKKVVVK